MRISEILSAEDIQIVKDACRMVREAEISIQAVIIDGVRYQPPN